MPIINGRITKGGAVIDVMVGISQLRRRLLKKQNAPIPEQVYCRAVIDTGASISGFAPRIFDSLGLTPVGQTPVLTPSTPYDQPHISDLFDVSLSLVANGTAHPFPDSRVMLADCWLAREGFDALIGRDILSHCNLWYIGSESNFVLNF